MKRVVLKVVIMAVFAVLAAFTSYEEGININVSSFSEGKITAKVENGNAYNSKISIVNAIVQPNANNPYNEDVRIASGTFSNGGFTLTLPAKPNDRFLVTMGDLLKEDPKSEISNMKAKVAIVYKAFSALGSDGKLVGEFYYVKDSDFLYSWNLPDINFSFR